MPRLNEARCGCQARCRQRHRSAADGGREEEGAESQQWAESQQGHGKVGGPEYPSVCFPSSRQAIGPTGLQPRCASGEADDLLPVDQRSVGATPNCAARVRLPATVVHNQGFPSGKSHSTGEGINKKTEG
ncbi:hypothetical protein EYF80_032016 [Liparis tanakae]|uniref:Uncharacterized protein n=1 Tax=Liparis tanakae TaxID=230148 RepID=A0A4Z2GVY1_9TELE|nr:hypothetical protein EYF80_032016 [Liparis tanakae]